ncbi:ADP-ribosyltransferase [Bacillus mycoides]|uniref:ADP-ribosyltransferase n=1 Tax=Bacillus mycoides TaxID=1405 RepID=UPI003D64BB2E
MFSLLGTSASFAETGSYLTTKEVALKEQEGFESASPKATHDFERDKEKAREWAEKRYSGWQKDLDKNEREEISRYGNNIDVANEINMHLEDTRGEVLEDSKFKKSIEEIDKALKNEKTDQPMYVYHRVNENFFGLEVGSLRSGVEINLEKFTEFKKDFVEPQSILKENGYINASLHGESPNLSKEPSIYIKLKVPQGVHGGYIGNFLAKEEANDFLIERGQGIQISNASIINQKGREFIKLEAELITDEKLKNELEKYNKELNDELGLNLVHLDLTERFFSSNYKTAQEAVKAIKGINTDFLEEAIDVLNIDYEKEYLLDLVDDKITKYESFKFLAGKDSNQLDPDGNPIKYDDINGLHLSLRDHATIVNFKKSPEPILDTLHELGHALDDLIFFTISEKQEFTQIHQEEQPSFLPDPYFKSRKEYFAECFAYYYSPDSNLKNKLKVEAEQSYNFIKNLKIEY